VRSSANGDLWTGVTSASTSPIAAAEATSGSQGGGLGSGVIAGAAILALGLVGLAGGVMATVARRRRSAASRNDS